MEFEGADPEFKLGRMSIDKQISGDLTASTVGQMLSAMTSTDGSAGYVAIERVTGVLNGKRGSFVLQHTGIMNREHHPLSSPLFLTQAPKNWSDWKASSRS